MISETCENEFSAVEREWHDQVKFCVDETKAWRQDPDDFARPRIHRKIASHCRAITAEPTLPIAVAQHHSLGPSWNLVCRREPSANFGWNAERLKNTVADLDGAHLLRFGHTGNVRRARDPHSQGLK